MLLTEASSSSNVTSNYACDSTPNCASCNDLYCLGCDSGYCLDTAENTCIDLSTNRTLTTDPDVEPRLCTPLEPTQAMIFYKPTPTSTITLTPFPTLPETDCYVGISVKGI